MNILPEALRGASRSGSFGSEVFVSVGSFGILSETEENALNVAMGPFQGSIEVLNILTKD